MSNVYGPEQQWPPPSSVPPAPQPVSGQPWPVSGQPWPVSGQPWPVPGQAYAGYPAAALPTPPKRNGGKIGLIVAAGLVPVLVMCGAVGFFFFKGVMVGLDEARNSPSASTSPTPDITAVPEVGVCYQGATTDRGFNARADSN